MQSRPTKITIKMGGKVPEIKAPTVQVRQESVEKEPNVVDVSSSDYSTGDEDLDTPSGDDSRKQMVLYDPSLNGAEAIEAVQNPDAYKPPSFARPPLGRVVPEVGAFTVQCANCYKWRLIPDQEKYEAIREHITDQPFYCETTRQWDRDVSCDDPTDIEQDGTRIWAIDKPNIAQPPPGWKRLLRLRSEGSSKFADVYYTSPTGTKLRSIPDVQRYLLTHPEHAQGVTVAQFSFQIPRPLRERKSPKPVEPIAWAGPEENELQLAEPLSWAGPAQDRNGAPEVDPVNQVAKKARRYDLDCL